MKRILSAAAAAALGLCLLTACGGDDSGDKASGGGGDYCRDLKSTKKEVDALKDGDFSGLQETTDQIHKLPDEAPDEIKEDWKILVRGVDKIVAAFKKAGLDEEDMANLQSGQMPDGRRHGGAPAAMTEIQALDTDEFHKAGDAITSTPRTSATSTCRTPDLHHAPQAVAGSESQPRLAWFRDGCCATSSTTGGGNRADRWSLSRLCSTVASLLLLALALALVAACGVFVAAEFSFVTVDRAQVDQDAAAGDASAQGLQKALRSPVHPALGRRRSGSR